MVWIALALLAVAAWHDLRTREIPDWISVALVGVAVGGWALDKHPAGWQGLLLGACLGLVLGAAFFALGGLGGGDVKLVAGLGAVLGPLALLTTLFWIAIIGGALSIAAAARGRKDLAYVPAILLGVLV